MSTPIEELKNRIAKDIKEAEVDLDYYSKHDVSGTILEGHIIHKRKKLKEHQGLLTAITALESANADLRANVAGLSGDAYEYTCEKCDKPIRTCPSCNYIIKGCDCGHCETGRYFEEDES